MDMKVRGKSIPDVRLIKADEFGYMPAEKTPANMAQMAFDRLVLEDAAGHQYFATKRGLYNKDEGWAGRGDLVEIGGKQLRAVHNIDRADTPGQKVWHAVARTADRAAFNVQMAALWVFARGQDVVMGVLGRGN